MHWPVGQSPDKDQGRAARRARARAAERGAASLITRVIGFLLAPASFLLSPAIASAQPTGGQEIGQGPITLPTMDQVVQVLLLKDYNTRLVVLAVSLLGMTAGLIGTFLLLRKRSLMGDVLSHATLPGVALAFMIMATLGMSGKALGGLLAGAAVFGVLGFLAVMGIRRFSRLKDDAAMGIVLSVGFGLGVAMLGLAQDQPGASAAGLESFIYGKTASMIQRDLTLIAWTAGAAGLLCLLFFKELTLLCFDDGYAAAQGWPTGLLDMVMLSLVVTVTVIGLQAVGLILIIALLLIPPAAARFWTDHLPRLMVGSALLGGASGWLGASLSALIPNLPAGAIIVVSGAGFFIFSLIFGPARGVLRRVVLAYRLKRKVARQHLLRAIYEIIENNAPADRGQADNRAREPVRVSLNQLIRARAWTRLGLRRVLRRLQREGLIVGDGLSGYRLTEPGWREAAKVVRNHRLWEIYLLTHADVAPNHVDRDADQIEHVLPSEMIAKLEGLLHEQAAPQRVPRSPHALGGAGGATGGSPA